LWKGTTMEYFGTVLMIPPFRNVEHAWCFYDAELMEIDGFNQDFLVGSVGGKELAGGGTNCNWSWNARNCKEARITLRPYKG
jgi:hypothetical protein